MSQSAFIPEKNINSVNLPEKEAWIHFIQAMVPFVYVIIGIWMGTFLVLVALNARFKKKRIADPESCAAFTGHLHEE